MTEYESAVGRRRTSGLVWLWAPVVLILFVGGALSVAAGVQNPSLSPIDSLATGFGALAAIIVGLFGAAIGVIVGLIGAVIGLVAAGGAVAVTLFLVGSPLLALVLLYLLLRRNRSCPDPTVH